MASDVASGPRWAEQLFLQSTELALIELDPAGVIVGWHGASEALFGHSAAQALGQPFAFALADDARSYAHTPGHSPKGFSERTYKHRDGSTFTSRGFAQDIRNESGELLGCSQVLMPGDAPVSTAPSGAARPALDASPRQLESLSTMAHDIRNPLGAITNAAFLLTRSTDETTRRRASEVLTRQLGVLRRLADDLTAMARSPGERG